MDKTEGQNQTNQQNQQYQYKTQETKKEKEEARPSAQPFHFSFAKQDMADKELRKPRSKAYMEVFAAIDIVSATDEEIISKLKESIDEDVVEDFSNMTTEELLEEIKESFKEEFLTVQLPKEEKMLGVLAKCYINGCDCHAITPEGQIIAHFTKGKPLPDGMEKGRAIFAKTPNCLCVEVYTDCCRVVYNDSTVVKVPDFSF